ncbi:MAG: hypothetical protein ISQ08_07285 [Planctomycetes bacterium]|nr:hypothetical protein [Planctomycetota bacterium]
MESQVMRRTARVWVFVTGALLLAPLTAAGERFPLGALGGTGEVEVGEAWVRVHEVQEGSPLALAGVQVEDRLVGLGGVPLPPHGKGVDAGGDGPQRALGLALDGACAVEDAEARVLRFSVVRGEEALQLTARLPHRPALGAEDPGPAREALRAAAAAQLRKGQRLVGKWEAPVGLTGDRWITAWALVALLEAGAEPDDEQLAQAARWLAGPDEQAWVNDDPLTKGPDNLGNWALAATCVALAEHDLARGMHEWKPTLERCAAALAARCSEEGRYGHDVITGYDGKGLNVINCLAHLAWERCEAAGAAIDRAAWDRSLASLRASIDPNGGMRYWTMKGTGTGDATLRTASLALALGRAGEGDEFLGTLLDYLERHPARAREAHAMGTPGLMLTPHALATRSPEARQAFLEEWRWYLALMRGPDDRLHYIGGKGNNGGDSYLGFGQVAAVTALMMLAEPRKPAGH